MRHMKFVGNYIKKNSRLEGGVRNETTAKLIFILGKCIVSIALGGSLCYHLCRDPALHSQHPVTVTEHLE